MAKQSRYSRRRPWAFNNYLDMRRTRTEYEVYRMLKVLERHSSFKKPYYSFGTHPIGELYYAWPGYKWPPWKRPPAGGGPGPGGSGCAGAPMVCNGGILDCKKGGDEIIACICGVPPYEVWIIADPTEAAWATGGWFPKVSLPRGLKKDLDPGTVIVARVVDSIGQSYVVDLPLANCNECCEEFTLSGEETVNWESTWTGYIIPPCPQGTASVSSNSSCGGLSAVLAADGATVTVDIGFELQCGSFTVTITDETDECDYVAASITVRITDPAGWGEWDKTSRTHCSDLADYCEGSPGCTSRCDYAYGCTVPPGCGCTHGWGPWSQDEIIVGEYMYGGYGTTPPVAPDWSWVIQCCQPSGCNGAAASSCAPPPTFDYEGGPCPYDVWGCCQWFGYYRYPWNCDDC